MRILIYATILTIVCGFSAAEEEAAVPNTLFQSQPDLAQNVPPDFPRFYFAGCNDEARLLSRYLWHHFDSRLGNGKTLFNKEYLTCADFWLAGAVDKQRKKPIQEVHREDILAMQLDPEGYVFTHQHFSHAHETGWPFPMWIQADKSAEAVAGKVAGWHFMNYGPGWVWGVLKLWNAPQWIGETAAASWGLENAKSLGIADNKWRIESTGDSPVIISPDGVKIEGFQSPYLQIRWLREPDGVGRARPYVEWQREGDSGFAPDRRVYFDYVHADPSESVSATTRTKHTMIRMYAHPKWNGVIKRLRFSLAPGESDAKFSIDSIFTCYDTRHTINNPIFTFSCWNCFRWTGAVGFLAANIDRMRRAMRYQMTEMGGLKFNHIRNSMPGHDGQAGVVTNADGSKTVRGGHGIGSNYWDILAFGWDDMYATSQYYASLLVMADIEQAVLDNPGWNIPRGALALDPVELRKHAAAVKTEANRKFWNKRTGRFVACIDSEGKSHDYGFTFLNLDAIWYGSPRTPTPAR